MANFGNGSDGAFRWGLSSEFGNLVPGVDYTTNGNTLYLKTNREFNFTTFTLDNGYTIGTIGNGCVLYINCTGNFNIQGTIDLRSGFISQSSITINGVSYSPRGTGQGGNGSKPPGLALYDDYYNEWAGYSAGGPGGAGLNGFGGGGGGGVAGARDYIASGGGGASVTDTASVPSGGSGGQGGGSSSIERGGFSGSNGGGGGGAGAGYSDGGAWGGNGAGGSFGATGSNGYVSEQGSGRAYLGAGGGGGAGGAPGAPAITMVVRCNGAYLINSQSNSIIGTGGNGSNGGVGGTGARFRDSGSPQELEAITGGEGGGGGGGGGGNGSNVFIYYTSEYQNTNYGVTLTGGSGGSLGANGTRVTLTGGDWDHYISSPGSTSGNVYPDSLAVPGSNGATGSSGSFSATLLSQVSFTKNSNCKIKAVRAKVATAKSRIIKLFQKTKTSNARIKIADSFERESNAKTVFRFQIQETGKSRIKKTYPFQKTTKSRIKVLGKKVERQSTAGLNFEKSFIMNSNARVKVPFRESINSTCRIKKPFSFNTPSKSSIAIGKLLQKTMNSSVKAKMKIEKSCIGIVLVGQNRFGKFGESMVAVPYQAEIESNARIIKPQIQTLNATSRLIKDLQTTIQANSRILIQYEFEKTGRSFVVFERDINKQTSARVLRIQNKMLESNSRIKINYEFEADANSRIDIHYYANLDSTGSVLKDIRKNILGNASVFKDALRFTAEGTASIFLLDRLKPVVSVKSLQKPILFKAGERKTSLNAKIPTKQISALNRPETANFRASKTKPTIRKANI